jgi:hypothetical protein
LPDVKTIPAEWLAALNDAIARKAIPDIPLSKNTTDDGNPVYPTGQTIYASFHHSVYI